MSKTNVMKKIDEYLSQSRNLSDNEIKAEYSDPQDCCMYECGCYKCCCCRMLY